MPVHITTNGDEFVVQALDRSYKGKLVEALKVDKDGAVTVAGQTISSSGVVGNVGAVTGSTAAFSSTLAVTGASTLTGNTAVGGTLGVTGATTLPAATTIGGKAPMTGSDYSVVQAGKNGTGALTLTGALIGDAVVAVANLTTPGDVKSSYEATVSVNGQIQQSSASNLSAQQILFVLHHY
jgi:fibronectin-binding autotransporter adhesin